MDNLIARVAGAADITPGVARKAVALIGDFIQREAPEEAVRDLFEKAPAFRAIIASSTQTGGEGMGGGLKGLMGVAAGAMGGGGLMALGAELMGLGLGMDRSHANFDKALRRIIEASHAAGIPTTMHAVSSAEVSRMIDMGFDELVLTADIGVLRRAFAADLCSARAQIEERAHRPPGNTAAGESKSKASEAG